MIADAQALTDNAENREKVRQNILQVALDYLACATCKMFWRTFSGFSALSVSAWASAIIIDLVVLTGVLQPHPLLQRAGPHAVAVMTPVKMIFFMRGSPFL